MSAPERERAEPARPRGVTVRLIGAPQDVAAVLALWPQVALTQQCGARAGGVMQYGVVMLTAEGSVLTARVEGG